MKKSWIAAFASVSLCSLLPFTAAAQNPNQVRVDLPEGAGKAMVEGVCTGCHQTNMISRSSGYNTVQWKELIGTMMDFSASPETADEIVRYLTQHFPPHTQNASKPMPGRAQVSFKEWVTPTLGQRTRDPVEAQDGAIWWVGQFGNVAGRLDPKTGEMKEYQLPPKALPHSINIDRDGNAWYTGNGNGTIGKIDAKTGQITEYKMPDPAARDPHTAEFDRNGIYWFTLQQSNMVGRLDPKTGEIKLAKTKTPGARPYGVKIDANGTPWYACNGSNCVAKIDPATMELTEISLPTPGTQVRRLDIAEDGRIWFVNSTKGKIGVYDPKTGAIKEWDSPSGPQSHPYAIAVVDGIVWYNESGVRPDMLVRFDPRTETFQSWPIPSGDVYAGIVRHMRPTRTGDLLIHQSSTNRIIQVSPQGAPDR
jgi:virginiamycin B lyase